MSIPPGVYFYQRLTEQGLKIWFDQNDIPLGVDFQNQIDDGIEHAHNFLFIVAPHSVKSPYCLKEVELAIKRNSLWVGDSRFLAVSDSRSCSQTSRNCSGSSNQLCEPIFIDSL